MNLIVAKISVVFLFVFSDCRPLNDIQVDVDNKVGVSDINDVSKSVTQKFFSEKNHERYTVNDYKIVTNVHVHRGTRSKRESGDGDDKNVTIEWNENGNGTGNNKLSLYFYCFV